MAVLLELALAPLTVLGVGAGICWAISADDAEGG